MERQNILVVDDRVENLLVLETILQGLEINIVKATSGQEALWQLLNNTFALILLDVQMPQMNGFEVAELIRKNNKTKTLPIIFVSAVSTEQKFIFKGYESGAVDYLIKPIEPEILKSKVNVFLQLHRQNQLILKQSADLQQSNEYLKKTTEALRVVSEYNRKLIEVNLDPIINVGQDGRIRDVNIATEIITGRSRKNLIDSEFTGYFTEPEKATELYRKAIDIGTAHDYELYILCYDGQITPVLCNASVYRDDVGSIIGVIVAARDISIRKEYEDNLMELNKNLETRVKDEVERRIRQEQLLIQQSKMAAMGEMISAIAHQWRQPLNALAILVQDIGDAYDYGELNKQYIDRVVNQSVAQISFMSKTIDDFRNFYSPEKEKKLFDVKKAAMNVLSLLSAQFMNNSISYRLTCHMHNMSTESLDWEMCCHDLTLFSYQGEFEHVLLNLINNAKDAIIEKLTTNENEEIEAMGMILIDFYKEDKKITIKISDNGGGIPVEIMNRIFEPYFTTKGPNKGTGVGLYMSKVIIEDNIGGRLYADNTDNGATFTIEIEKDKGR
ncbi:MAG: response regulator [Magnetococcales bacterium]|uniref:histidine kinase n=1 Tax=Candidatus Magnetobacterium casense TaxID=1455061 RepID=A0ABS6RUP3_9BACT|nr:response regulator [Candidatus Magnetobacterium casensis]MBF0606626.1 response regulator [Nitrospirota bacterium]MBV6339998.1 response regulator [Candidatus Magnetobacterium casensis]